MVIPEWVITTSLFTLCAGLWGAVMFVLPRNLRSVFRYRLWRLRDEVIDDKISGRLPDSPLVRDFVGAIESCIEHASEVTLLRWLAMPVSPSLMKRHRAFVAAHLRDLSQDGQELFQKRRGELQVIVMRRLMYGSPSGWFLLTGLGLYVLVVEPARALRRASFRALVSLRHYLKALGATVRQFALQHQITAERLVTFEGVAERDLTKSLTAQL